MSTFKEKVHDVLDYDPDAGLVEKVVTFGLVVLILANVIAVILESEPSLGIQYADFFIAFEAFSVVIFTIEYILRVWSITVDPQYNDPVRGRLRFMVTPLAIIDVLSIAPYYMPFLIPIDLRTLRVLRLFRILRLFKMARYNEALDTFARVFRNKREQLLVTVAVALILLIIASSLMYSVEHEAQPDKFPSIIGTMWWAIATLTTIGYGDVYPITPLGKALSGAIAVLGIALFGLPAGILAAGFIEEIQRKGNEISRICPHCGNHIDDVKEGSDGDAHQR